MSEKQRRCRARPSGRRTGGGTGADANASGTSTTSRATRFLAPWLIGLFAFTLIPMVYSLYLSLTKFNLLTAPQWIGVDNYVRLFSDERYLQSIKVTLLYVVASVPLKLAAALLVAVALNRGLKALGFYRATFYLPSLLGRERRGLGDVAADLLPRRPGQPVPPASSASRARTGSATRATRCGRWCCWPPGSSAPRC